MNQNDMNARFIRNLEETTLAFTAEFGDLSREALNWKPSTDRWSIAQVMDHLIVTNESYFPIFMDILDGKFNTPFLGRIPFIPGLMGKMIIKAVKPDNRMKTKTFPKWEPGQQSDFGNILEKFRDHQVELADKIRSMEAYTDKGLIIHSPVSKKIVYPLRDAIEIMVVHEARHLNQARKVLEEYVKYQNIR